MNKAFSTKWIYIYAINREALRRKVMCACHTDDPNNFLSSLGTTGNQSVLLGFVNATLGRNSRAREVINQDFRIPIRDGHHTDFWNDDWMSIGQLHGSFLTIFALATFKVGRVNDFGHWEDVRWRWVVNLGTPNKVILATSSSSRFFSRSLQRLLIVDGHELDRWKGL